jgi:hypothetical protein
MKLKIFFCQFPNPWILRVSGMGGYTSKCEKSQNHCTLLHRFSVSSYAGFGVHFWCLSFGMGQALTFKQLVFSVSHKQSSFD